MKSVYLNSWKMEKNIISICIVIVIIFGKITSFNFQSGKPFIVPDTFYF